MGLLSTDTGLLVAAEAVNVTGDLHVGGSLSMKGDIIAPNIASLAAELSSLAGELNALLEWKDNITSSSVFEQLYVSVLRCVLLLLLSVGSSPPPSPRRLVARVG